MTSHNYKEIIEEMLTTGMMLSMEKERIKNLFSNAGIEIDGRNQVVRIPEEESPEETIKNLMDQLSEMPVIKISSKQVLRKHKLSIR